MGFANSLIVCVSFTDRVDARKLSKAKRFADVVDASKCTNQVKPGERIKKGMISRSYRSLSAKKEVTKNKMNIPEQDIKTVGEIHDALERITKAATSLFNDWQHARTFLPSGCRPLMMLLTQEQTHWLERFDKELQTGNAKTLLTSFERFAQAVHRRIEAHASSPLALVGEVFENDEEERLFFRRWKAFLDSGIGTLARTFQIDDVIFAAQIVASYHLVGVLREITAEWAHIPLKARRDIALQFRENAQALSDAYGTASSADFIVMKERFAERLREAYHQARTDGTYEVEPNDRDLTLFRAAGDRFTRGVVSTVRSAIVHGERGGPSAVKGFRYTLEAGAIFLRLPGDDEQTEYYRRTLLPRLEALLT